MDKGKVTAVIRVTVDFTTRFAIVAALVEERPLASISIPLPAPPPAEPERQWEPGDEELHSEIKELARELPKAFQAMGAADNVPPHVGTALALIGDVVREYLRSAGVPGVGRMHGGIVGL